MQPKPATRALSKTLLLASFISLSACAGKPGTPPAIEAKIYAGSSEEAGIRRVVPGQPEEHVKATDYNFNNYVCTTDADLTKIVSTLVGACKQWK